MQQKVRDIDAGRNDQLPSVEEAKINLELSKNFKSQSTFKYTLYIISAVIVLLVLLVAFVLVGPLKDDAPVLSETGFGIPSNGNAMDKLDKTVVDTEVPSNGLIQEDEGRFADIMEILEGVSHTSDLETQESSQNLALNWIVNQDEFHVSSSNPGKLIQRYIVALVYFAMRGEQWEQDLGFLSDQDECTWAMVEPSAVVGDIKLAGVSCNEEGKVAQLRFPPGYLVGTLPAELRFLVDLETIALGNNKGIIGGIPDFVRDLPKLQHLALNHCSLTGEIPDWLGVVSSMESLILSNNGFTGSLPTSISALTDLQYLYLDDNKISSDIELFGGLTNLKHLVLEDNDFEGQLPVEMINNLSSLEMLDMSQNIGIKGSLPSNIWGLKELSVLDLNGCSLQGSVPPTEKLHTKLRVLSLSNNHFSGHLPDLIGFTLAKLQQLDLSRNNFASALPASLGELGDLEYLFVASNPFEAGPIPTFLSSMPNLKDLSLKATNRVGSIPAWMGSLNLSLLDLDGNDLTGIIPATLGEMTTLQHLLLNRNKLEGNVPESLSKLPNLATLLLDNNGITGSMDHVCSSADHPNFFTADCGGSSPEVTCKCCTLCCEAGDDSCNTAAWSGGINPIWENGHERGEYYDFKHIP